MVARAAALRKGKRTHGDNDLSWHPQGYARAGVEQPYSDLRPIAAPAGSPRLRGSSPYGQYSPMPLQGIARLQAPGKSVPRAPRPSDRPSRHTIARASHGDGHGRKLRRAGSLARNRRKRYPQRQYAVFQAITKRTPLRGSPLLSLAGPLCSAKSLALVTRALHLCLTVLYPVEEGGGSVFIQPM